MINNVLQIIYYILAKFFNFMFGSYIIEGVSIGMIFVVLFIFGIMFNYVLAIPKVAGVERNVVTERRKD